MKSSDVLERAIELIRAGKVRESCIENCLFCAIAQAKTELDIETGEGVSNITAISQFARQDFQEMPEDKPLVDARDILMKLNGPQNRAYTNTGAILELKKALKEAP